MTVRPESSETVAMSVILPASNEASLIGSCLRALIESRWADEAVVECIVVANGCHDDTAGIARARAQDFAERRWSLVVLELAEGGKLAALNAGDAAARGANRLYLDADVTVSPDLLAELHGALCRPGARYASGCLRITARGMVSRAYARIWRRVPFMSQCVPGCGVYAVNAEGRRRWDAFPGIISDDTFVRLCFTPRERVAVAAPYDWPIAEGWRALVRVRRRQDAGVAEIEERYPALIQNDDKPDFPISQKLSLALRDPIGFAVYSGVALCVKLRPAGRGWSRGR